MGWRITVGTSELPGSAEWEKLEEDFLDALASMDLLAGVVGWGELRSLGAVFSVDTSSMAIASMEATSACELALSKIGVDAVVGLTRLAIEVEDADAAVA